MIIIIAPILAIPCAVWLVWYMRRHIDISNDNNKRITHDNKSERPKDRR